MKKEGESEFILLDLSSGKRLFNTAYIVQVEKNNEHCNIYLRDKNRFSVNHTFDEILEALPNVIRLGSENIK